MTPTFDKQKAIDDQTGCGDLLDFKGPLKPPLPFESRIINSAQGGTLFSFSDYLLLVDWTGRAIRSDKQGFIDQALPPMLERLDITPEQ